MDSWNRLKSLTTNSKMKIYLIVRHLSGGYIVEHGGYYLKENAILKVQELNGTSEEYEVMEIVLK
jgi:hypothetical protein